MEQTQQRTCSTRTAVLLKPHCGACGLPFMNKNTCQRARGDADDECGCVPLAVGCLVWLKESRPAGWWIYGWSQGRRDGGYMGGVKAGGMVDIWVGRLANCALYCVRERISDPPRDLSALSTAILSPARVLGCSRAPQLTVRGTFVVRRV
jgi:hypothetical protein